MTRQSLTALLLSLVLLGCSEDSPTGPSQGGRDADNAAINAIVAKFDAAWTAKDPVSYAAQYAAAEWVGPTGAIQSNPEAIKGVYTGILTLSPLAGSVRQSTVRDLDYLSDTIAVLDIDARVTGFTNTPPGIVPWQPGVIRILEKNILARSQGTWRIVKHQQTMVAPGS